MSFGRALVLALTLLCLAGCRGCDARRVGRDAETTAAGPRPTLRLVYITDLKGYLEPCGCTSRPLGGVHRLGGILERLGRDHVPTAFVATGDIFFQGPSTPASAQQDAWQAETVADVLASLHLTAVVPGSRDADRDEASLAAIRRHASFPWLATRSPAAIPTVPILTTNLGGTLVAFVGITDAFGGTQAELLEAARTSVASAHTAGARLVVAMVRGDRRLSRAVTQSLEVDFVIAGGIDSETPEPPTRRGRAWVLEGGYQGQRVVVVDLFLRDRSEFRDESLWTRTVERQRLLRENEERRAQIASWEQAGTVSAADLAAQREAVVATEARVRALDREPDLDHGNVLRAEVIELASGAPELARIASMQEALAIRVNDHNRTALAESAPPPVTEGSATYAGTPACRSCHASAYEWWRHHQHGRAYATLVDRHREFNLQCVSCHVTGYGRPGGSTVTHNLDGALVNVGCESCHGPGSLHVVSQRASDIRLAVPESTCTTCHNHEHSDHFAYDVYLRRVVVPGHGQPLARPP